MTKKLRDLSEIITPVIEKAFSMQDYSLNFYDYLKENSIKKSEIIQFLNSNVYLSIIHQISEIDMYLDGDENFFETYNWMGKERATQLKEYLKNIILDARQYEIERKPGRKPTKLTDK